MKRLSLWLFIVVAVAGCSESPTAVLQRPALSVAGPAVSPTLVSGNISGTGDQVCNNPAVNSTGGTWFGIKVDPPVAGTFAGFTITLSSDGRYLSWSALSGFVMRAVVVKGGPDTNVYKYGDPAPSSDSGLQSPPMSNGVIPAISHYVLCYTVVLNVTKTANTSFDRTYAWNIDKSADQTSLTLADGQAPFPVNYTVTVSKTGAVDSNFAVAGTITVQNPAPVAATITGVSDLMSGVGAVAVSCAVSFPYALAAGASLSCSYSSALPDNTARTNTATAVSSTAGIGNGSGVANVVFGSTPTNEFDECANVGDSLYGSLGSVCVANLVGNSKIFQYALNFPSTQVTLECGEQTVQNTATLSTNDSQTTDSDSWSVAVTRTCVQVCTLSNGYWKTHSQFGPAPYDARWVTSATPNGGATSFFGHSSNTWYSVFWTPPAGNAYYQLAHQYMAAVLNVQNGAVPAAAVQAVLSSAQAFFQANAPGAKLAGTAKTNAIAWAGTLEYFNAGPTHCSEK